MPPDKADDRAGKTVLAEIVAHAEHQRLIDLGFDRLLGDDFPAAVRHRRNRRGPAPLRTSAAGSELAAESSANEPPSNTSSSWPPTRLA
jgi:hypothetical protein